MAVSIRLAPERYTTRRMALAALAGVVTCVAGLLWRQNRLGGLPLLDNRGWYTPPPAAALFEALDRLDANAREVYAATGLTTWCFWLQLRPGLSRESTRPCGRGPDPCPQPR